MNLSNIISAGRMMAVVLSLLGTIYGAMAFVQMRDGMEWEITIGVAMLLCGQILMLLFGRLTQKMASDTSHPHSPDATDTQLHDNLPQSPGTPGSSPADTPCPKPLGTTILVFGTLVMLSGVAGAVMVWRNPLSWMTAIVGIAIFIDALCLRIALSQK